MKILILSASTGGGHNRTAAALKKTITENEPDSQVRIEDALEYVSHAFNKLVVNGYFFFVKKAPHLYGVAYRISDKKSPISGIVNMATDFFGKRLITLVEEFEPDVIVATHPFTANMAACAKKKYSFEVPIISIVTDYAPHRAYINDNVDKYIVSSEEMISSMESLYDISPERIVNLGIPIDNKFYDRINRRDELEKIGFDTDKTTALFMAGSFGVTEVLKIYENISALENDFQVIIITGNNDKLYSKFIKLLESNPTGKKTHLIKFTDEVEKYMQLADVIITKPGGLTVTESLATGLPMVIFKAYPGQEEDNTDYLLRKGSAVQIKKPKYAPSVFLSLLEDPEKLSDMKRSSLSISCEHSADKIYQLIKDITDNKNIRNIDTD